jgi:KDO2-lipid IV(A) lauroyltransferase
MKGAGRKLAAAAMLPVDFFLTVLVLAVAAPLWLLPWKWAAGLGELYGRCAYGLWPVARRAGWINLRRAYGPSMDRARAARWTREVFGGLGRSIAEGVQFARRFKSGRDPGGLIDVEDPALEARILDDPRPKIFVTGHLGSWEVAIGAVSRRAASGGAVIIRRIDNSILNAVVRRLRLRRGSEWIEKRGASSEALRRLRAGESIALLADENGGARGVFVDFFGRAASTHKTPALLSALTGAPIVVGAALRRGGRFRFKLAVVEPRIAGPGAADAEIRRLTAEVASILEEWVREAPTQWRWIHWRWRSRPDGSEESYGDSDVAACFGDDAPAPWKTELDADA